MEGLNEWIVSVLVTCEFGVVFAAVFVGVVVYYVVYKFLRRIDFLKQWAALLALIPGIVGFFVAGDLLYPICV